MKRIRYCFLALTAMLVQFPGLFADISADVSGSLRNRFAVQADDGAVFINEQQLFLGLEAETDSAYLYSALSFRIQDSTVVSGDFKELYAGWYGDFFDFRAGLQKILWGKADGVFITDVVSPLDLSSFLTADIDDLRIGVSGAKFDLYQGAHKLEFVWIPVFTPSEMPQSGSIWTVSPAFPVPLTMQAPSIPEASLENSEFFSRYSWLGSLLDVQVMGGWYWNDTPIATVADKTVVPGVGLSSLTILPEYYRVGILGTAFSVPAGPVILRAESAVSFNKRFPGTVLQLSSGWKEKNAVNYMIGADVSLLGATLSVQWIQDIILDYEDSISREESLETVTGMVQRSFFRETLKTEIFGIYNIKSEDAMIKPSITWYPGGGFEMSVGAWFFIGESGQFGQYDENDGFNARLAYYF